jgi:hypothetical protein
VSTQTLLTCDWCDDDGIWAKSTHVARAQAAREGYVRIGKQDFCKNCAEAIRQGEAGESARRELEALGAASPNVT